MQEAERRAAELDSSAVPSAPLIAWLSVLHQTEAQMPGDREQAAWQPEVQRNCRRDDPITIVLRKPHRDRLL